LLSYLLLSYCFPIAFLFVASSSRRSWPCGRPRWQRAPTRSVLLAALRMASPDRTHPAQVVFDADSMPTPVLTLPVVVIVPRIVMMSSPRWASAPDCSLALGGSKLARSFYGKVRASLPRQPLPPASIPQDTPLTGAVLLACTGGLHLRSRRISHL